MKFVIASGEPEVQSGTSTAGKPYTLRKQTAMLHRGEERIRIELTLGRSEQAYAAGTYELDPSSFRVGEFGELELGRVRLVRSAAQGDSPRRVA